MGPTTGSAPGSKTWWSATIDPFGGTADNEILTWLDWLA
jgi:hypothetical protein